MNAIVVDDHQVTRDNVSRLLAAEGFAVRSFATADSAAAALTESSGAVDIVVTDVKMPGRMDGVDLVAMLAVARPSLPVVVMSTDPRELVRTSNLGLDVPTLEKPVNRDALVVAVAEAMYLRSRTRSPRLADRHSREVADPRRVLAMMFTEAEQAAHPHVGSEHVALAALEGAGGFLEIATLAGLAPAELRPALLASCTLREAGGERGLTFRASMLVAVASQLAIFDRTKTVRPGDLVRALLGAPDAVAWAGLTAAGLGHRRVVETLKRASVSSAENALPTVSCPKAAKPGRVLSDRENKMADNEPLTDLLDRLRASEPSERITLRPSFLSHGAACIQPLVDLALEVPDLTATVASWLGTLAVQQPDTTADVVEGLKELTDGPESGIVRDVLGRLGAAAPRTKTKSERPIVRSTAEAEVHARIIKAAKEGRTVYYSDLETSRGHIGRYLFNISQIEAEQSRPPLTSIVILKATGRPGEGFLPAMLEVGYAEPGEPLDVVWRRAVADVHTFWDGK